MEKFYLSFISILIFVSTSSTAERIDRAFVSCNKTALPTYQVCKTTQNSSVLVGVSRPDETKSTTPKSIFLYLPPTDLYFYPTDNSSCATPTIVQVPDRAFHDISNVNSIRMECTVFREPLHLLVDAGSVRKITLINNKFTEFPREYCANITFLENISIRDQQIADLSPASFTKITKYLEELQLVNIQLETIEPGTFENFFKLTTLDLRMNRLKILRPDMFDGLQSLEYLHLGSNRIGTIKPGAFAPLTNLRHLFLEMNHLVKVPEKIFRDLQRLQSLSLNGNAISIDYSTLVEGLDKLNVLYWGANETIKLECGEISFWAWVGSGFPTKSRRCQ